MREYLFRGKRTDNGEWMYGAPVEVGEYVEMYYFNFEEYEMEHHLVAPETIGQYTGMNEFVASDMSYNKPLFEGDIVEVWGWRSPRYTYDAKSQYDGKIKVRATICFEHGEWTLDYTNKHNQSLAKLKGKEIDEREVTGEWSLHRLRGCTDEKWLREQSNKWHDIVKIGNVFENKDLLEG